MTARKKTSVPLWDRPARRSRPAPKPLSTERIVRAAIAIADKRGLAEVSLRHIAAALDAGPMRLYGYVATKEELLERMVDEVYGEMARTAPPRRGSWRKALRSVAHGMRRAVADHPWFIELLGGRPHLGPHALAYLEAALAAVELDDIDHVMLALKTVSAYVIGALRSEASDVASGRKTRPWQSAPGLYIQRLVATGNFPLLDKVFREASHPAADVIFEQGLDCVLDGIAARLL